MKILYKWQGNYRLGVIINMNSENNSVLFVFVHYEPVLFPPHELYILLHII